MTSYRHIITLLLIVILSSFAVKAAAPLKDQVEKILRLKLPPEEVADSASKAILRYDTQNQAASTPSVYAECKEAYSELLLPFALRNGVSDSRIAYIYDEIGRLLMTKGRSAKDDADANFVNGISHAEKAGDWYRMGRLLEHQGFNEIKYGDQVKGFEVSQKAIDAYRKSQDDADRYITRCYYMQAVVYLQLGDMDGMAKIIADMERFVPEVKEDNRLFHLYNLYSVQEVYFAHLMEAAEDSRKKKEYADLFNSTNLKTVLLIDSSPSAWRQTSVNPSWNYYNRAAMFVNTCDRPPMDSVIHYCEKALRVDHFNKGEEDLEVLTSTSMVIAEGWMKNGDYSKASRMLLDALEKLRKQAGVNNLIQDRIQIFELLKDIAVKFGRNEEAFAFSDSVRRLEAERFSIEKATAVKDLEVKYQTQETELALAQSESRRASTLMWLFAAVGLMLIGVIAFILYAARERRRRLQQEMEFASLRDDIGRHLTQQYVEGLENERKRMSRELHDGVCNDLLAIQMGIAQGKPMQNTAELLNDCRESLRRISHELMPPEFAYASLDEVVRFFVMKQADVNAGKIEVLYSSSAVGRCWTDVPDAVALDVYRIAQEAVGNAVKHSGCNEIKVNMTLDGSKLTLKVADNGLFEFTRDKGFGLQSMRKRAEAIGGSIRIDHNTVASSGEEPQGTVVTLKLNIN